MYIFHPTQNVIYFAQNIQKMESLSRWEIIHLDSSLLIILMINLINIYPLSFRIRKLLGNIASVKKTFWEYISHLMIIQLDNYALDTLLSLMWLCSLSNFNFFSFFQLVHKIKFSVVLGFESATLIWP